MVRAYGCSGNDMLARSRTVNLEPQRRRGAADARRRIEAAMNRAERRGQL
jgi:hypothetical protein